jgi:3-methyladenine DNA glycosylase AlkC
MAKARLIEMHAEFELSEQMLADEAEAEREAYRKKQIHNVLNKILKQKQLMTTDTWKRNVQVRWVVLYYRRPRRNLGTLN